VAAGRARRARRRAEVGGARRWPAPPPRGCSAPTGPAGGLRWSLTATGEPAAVRPARSGSTRSARRRPAGTGAGSCCWSACRSRGASCGTGCAPGWALGRAGHPRARRVALARPRQAARGRRKVIHELAAWRRSRRPSSGAFGQIGQEGASWSPRPGTWPAVEAAYQDFIATFSAAEPNTPKGRAARPESTSCTRGDGSRFLDPQLAHRACCPVAGPARKAAELFHGTPRALGTRSPAGNWHSLLDSAGLTAGAPGRASAPRAARTRHRPRRRPGRLPGHRAAGRQRRRTAVQAVGGPARGRRPCPGSGTASRPPRRCRLALGHVRPPRCLGGTRGSAGPRRTGCRTRRTWASSMPSSVRRR